MCGNDARQLDHETVVAYHVESPKTSGVGWYAWTGAISLGLAREFADGLKRQGGEARIVKETSTIVREVVE